MQKSLLILLISLSFITACKKSGGNSNGKANLLKRYVFIHNQDSVAYDLTYDQNNRISFLKFSGTGFGPGLNISTTQITRNRSEQITQLINSYPSPNPDLNPNDTTNIFLDNAGQRYRLMLTYHKIDAYGQPIDIRDSSLFIYDNAGNISQKISYDFGINTIGSYELGYIEFYRFDQQRNLLTDSLVGYYGGTGAPQHVLTYTYDNHPNPLQLGNEAFLFIDRDWIGCPRISGWASKNNVLTGYYTQSQSTISNFSIQRSFEYNTNGLPTGSTGDIWWTASVYGTTPGSSRYYY
jgi:hypothetical protein